MSRAPRSTSLVLAACLACALWPAALSSAQATDPHADDVLARLTQVLNGLDARDLEGRRWTAAAVRNRIVVIDFWATWCAPCLAEIPVLRRITEEFGPDVIVLGVSLDVADRRTVASWMNRQRVDWPQIYDGRGYNGEVPRRFEVASLPTSILVGRDGRVVATNLRGERLYAAVQSLASPRQ